MLFCKRAMENFNQLNKVHKNILSCDKWKHSARENVLRLFVYHVNKNNVY